MKGESVKNRAAVLCVVPGLAVGAIFALGMKVANCKGSKKTSMNNIHVNKRPSYQEFTMTAEGAGMLKPSERHEPTLRSKDEFVNELLSQLTPEEQDLVLQN